MEEKICPICRSTDVQEGSRMSMKKDDGTTVCEEIHACKACGHFW